MVSKNLRYIMFYIRTFSTTPYCALVTRNAPVSDIPVAHYIIYSVRDTMLRRAVSRLAKQCSSSVGDLSKLQPERAVWDYTISQHMIKDYLCSSRTLTSSSIAASEDKKSYVDMSEHAVATLSSLSCSVCLYITLFGMQLPADQFMLLLQMRRMVLW